MRSSTKRWPSRIAGYLLAFFTQRRKKEDRYDPGLGDQVRLPRELLDAIHRQQSNR